MNYKIIVSGDIRQNDFLSYLGCRLLAIFLLKDLNHNRSKKQITGVLQGSAVTTTAIRKKLTDAGLK